MSHSKSAWTYSLALVAIAVVSLALKFLIVRSDVALSTTSVSVKLAAIAEARGMKTNLRPIFGGLAMFASKDGCELAVQAMPPSGEVDQVAAGDFRTFKRLRYSFEGVLSDAKPQLRPLATYQWARALNRVGIATAWRPLLLVGDNGHCPAELTDFGDVSDVLRQQVGSAART